MRDFEKARDRMVKTQIERRGVRDVRVLDALRRVPRELFVEPGWEEFAYEDGPLPIGEGQTISQPYTVALMLEAAALQPGDHALEVGAGSGYAAAVLSRLVDRVCAIERHPSLVAHAAARLESLHYANVKLHIGDGTTGWTQAAPFDAIVVAAGAPEVPAALKEQLVVGGRLVIPVGDDTFGQRLVKITRKTATDYVQKDLGRVSFVPLIGEQGWADDGGEAASNLPMKIAPSLSARSTSTPETPPAGPPERPAPGPDGPGPAVEEPVAPTRHAPVQEPGNSSSKRGLNG